MTYDANILVIDVQGGDISARKRIVQNSQFWLSYYLLKKRPKLGIQIPNAGDGNQSCHILTVIFNRIKQLRILKYDLYFSNFFYINVSFSTALQGGVSAGYSSLCLYYSCLQHLNF